ncbi:MAG: RNA polymerase-binding protein DksA [Deltaproteobacteria bacterium]|nr:RNA polymerase-binding protein DksA [Deltaproteobacteria bacterium]
MEPERLEYFKTLLQERLSVLLTEARATVTDLAEGDENYADPTDRAAAESDRNFLLRIRDRERKLIVKIQEALQRVEEGTFGVCETCGDEIGEKRLEARPVTTQCIDCKTEAEKKERTGS